jgi:hypothetical protein
MTIVERSDGLKLTRATRLVAEPTFHFFLIAAGLLMAHRVVVGDPRTIVITPALKADLVRRYQDQIGRPPTSAEAAAFIDGWKGDEALYREALREGIDRDDPMVRNVLISKMRERALLQTRIPEPTDAELQQYLALHRDQFEVPLLYEYEYVTFVKADAGAESERAKYERQLRAGATPASLGLRSTAANVNRERIDREFGPEVADEITRLPPGQWQELETGDRLLLVKLIGVQGGLSPPDLLRAQLVAAFKGEKEQQAVAQAAKAIAARYRFEEASR